MHQPPPVNIKTTIHTAKQFYCKAEYNNIQNVLSKYKLSVRHKMQTEDKVISKNLVLVIV